ncbi:hypothetical protein [Erwinia phage Snitter]|nr:hypothetical protein [Erwinia phage Snitter]
MSFGAMMLREDGTPFFIQDTVPMCLVRRQDFNVNATENSGNGTSITLDAIGSVPYLYFVRFNQSDGWGYQSASGNQHRLIVGAFSSGNVSGRIYVFGAQFQPTPAMGIAIYDSQGRCILTNETVVLKGINIVNPTGNAGTADYLNETIGGRIAIIPARCGAVVYSQFIGGNIITQIIQRSTGCWFNGTNTIVRSNQMGRSSASIGVSSTKGSGYAPPYINCNLYD